MTQGYPLPITRNTPPLIKNGNEYSVSLHSNVTFDNNGLTKKKYRVTNSLLLPLKKKVAINNRNLYEEIPPLHYRHALHETRYHMHKLFQHYPFQRLLINKKTEGYKREIT